MNLCIMLALGGSPPAGTLSFSNTITKQAFTTELNGFFSAENSSRFGINLMNVVSGRCSSDSNWLLKMYNSQSYVSEGVSRF